MAIVTRDGVDGKICTECGEWKPISEFHKKLYSRDGHRPTCKVCTNASNKQRANQNREWERERQRAYYIAHKEEKPAYRMVNAERQHTFYQQWYKKNQERMREYKRAYYHSHPEVTQKAGRKWEAANPDKRRAIDRRRRARKQNAEGSFTEQEWQDLKAHYNYTCLRCGKSEPDILLTVDHVIPLEKRGSNYISNIQPLCGSCNGAKGTKSTDYRPASSETNALPMSC